MSLIHVTKDGKCAYCGAKMVLCPVCKEFFYQKREDQVYCRDRCKKRKARMKATS